MHINTHIKIFAGTICFLIVFSFSILTSAGAQEKIISEIKIEGLNNHGPEVVMRTISTQKGDYISNYNIRNDIKKLYKLMLFSDIQIKADESDKGLVLTYIVKENPILHNIEFLGNENISDKDLEEELKKLPVEESFRIGIGYYPGREKRAIDQIIDLYRSKGYLYVSASIQEEYDQVHDRMVITFNIDEGSKEEVRIEEIKFTGNKTFSDFRLRRQMETEEHFWFFQDGFYKENIFKGDLKKIVEFYKEKGFASAKVLKHSIVFDEEKKMHILVDLYEGPKYSFGEIKVVGNNVFSNDELLSEVKIKKGEIYNIILMNRDSGNIMNKYTEKGYIYAQVKPEESTDEENKTVSILYKVVENSQMYLNKIKISGNDITKDKVIRRELTIIPGEIFNSKKVRRSVQRVFNLGYFKDIKIDTEPGNAEDNLNLKLMLEEKPTGQANFAATYSAVDGLIGQVQIAKNNLFGYGQRVDITYEFGENLQNYELGFTDPYIFDTRFLFGFTVFNTIRTRYTYDDFGERDINGNVNLIRKRSAYEYHKLGGSLRIGRPLSENLNFSLRYNYEDGEYSSVGSYPIPSDVTLGETATRSLTSIFTYDNRDNVFNPSSGVKYKFMWERAGGFLNGDNHYNKFVLDNFWYMRTFSKFVLMLRMQTGLVDPYGASDDVPPIEKFSIGGGTTVRGYSERGIADRKKREFFVNLEHKYPLEENVNFVTFIDSGNAWDETEEMAIDDMKSGFGIGFHLETPIGPIRLDYGWGLDLEPGDEKGKFHFNLGWGFY